jgi:glycosyltransferase involved in cell wall biosynthesis
LSVVLPAFNGAAYIGSALASIVSQRDAGVEVVVVDDGSSDGTIEVVERFHESLSLRVIEGPRRGNWAAATNAGIKVARGEYVSILHQDDLWLEGRLQAVRALLRQVPDATLVLHSSVFIDETGQRVGVWRCPLPAAAGPLPAQLVVDRLLVQNFIAMPAPLFRREAALQAGGLDESLWYTADWDLWLTLAERGPTLFCSRLLAAFRVHSDSQTAFRAGENSEMHRQSLVVLDRHFGRCGGPVHHEIEAVARFSAALNAALAGASAGGPLPWGIAARFFALGPRGWRRYLRDSRIVERLRARVNARLRKPGRSIPQPARAGSPR